MITTVFLFRCYDYSLYTGLDTACATRIRGRLHTPRPDIDCPLSRCFPDIPSTHPIQIPNPIPNPIHIPHCGGRYLDVCSMSHAVVGLAQSWRMISSWFIMVVVQYNNGFENRFKNMQIRFILSCVVFPSSVFPIWRIDFSLSSLFISLSPNEGEDGVLPSHLR